jgi:hypothetical protein
VYGSDDGVSDGDVKGDLTDGAREGGEERDGLEAIDGEL